MNHVNALATLVTLAAQLVLAKQTVNAARMRVLAKRSA